VYYETLIDGTILEISPSIGTISKKQYNRNELIGKSINDFYLNAEERKAFLSAIQERGSVTDYEVMLKTGTVRIFHLPFRQNFNSMLRVIRKKL